MTAIKVEFHGYDHSNLNLQAIPWIKTAIAEQIQASSGKHIVFLESSAMTKSAARETSQFNQELGFFRARIATDFWYAVGRYPTTKELEDRVGQICDLDLDTALKKNLIPYNRILYTYLAKVLDEFRDDGLESVYEGHSKNSVEQNKRLNEQGKHHALDALDALGTGNFDTAVNEWRQTYACLVSGAFYRESGRGDEDKGIIDLAKTQIKGLKRAGRGSLFILFGDDHSIAYNRIKGPFASDPDISLDLKRHLPPQEPHAIIFQLLRERQVVPAELYAQDLFLNGASIRLENLALEEKCVSSCAENWETLHDTLSLVVRQFSLEEMRAICEDRTDIYSVVKKHPLAESIRGLLP